MVNHMVLTVAEIINRPLFQKAEIIAGKYGLDRAIRWVHVLETSENVSSLNGGELILSTGLALGSNESNLLDFVHKLIQRKTAGLCLRIGPHVKELGSRVNDLAEKHNFPIIIFRDSVPFVDITLDLHEIIVDRQTKVLRNLESFARGLQKLAIQSHSLIRILNYLETTVKAQVFLISLDGPSYVVPEPKGNSKEQLIENLKLAFYTVGMKESGGEFQYGSVSIVYFPVRAMGHTMAYLGMYKNNSHLEYLLQLLDYAANTIAQILLRTMFSKERSLEFQNRFLDDILKGKLYNQEQLCSVLGFKTKDSLRNTGFAAVCELRKETQEYSINSPFDDLLGFIRSLANTSGFSVVTLNKGFRLYLLLIDLNNSTNPLKHCVQFINKLKSFCSESFEDYSQLFFGVSRPLTNYNFIKRAFQEAEQVLELNLTQKLLSPFYSEIGVERLFMNNTEDHLLKAFIEDYLGPILHYDETHGTDLLQTLKVFLSSNQNKQEAADHLFIRRQSLYHRLNKIEELLGDTYLQPDKRFALELAIKIHQWLSPERDQTQFT
ncbi:MAG: PucR family transcriptional regulator ligand-binding domain-containing protein [Desulfitobacterium hafniense]|nr:PucR family transcriptional regulator ligand-binding domain-containing protein [Desulfitobacterium hafniense]